MGGSARHAIRIAKIVTEMLSGSGQHAEEIVEQSKQLVEQAMTECFEGS